MNIDVTNTEWVKKVRRGEKDLKGANLSSADLRRVDLSSADLAGADLRRANLDRSVLNGIDLNRAKLDHASLQSAALNGANLNNASLVGANLHGANLVGANLNKANLNKAQLAGAYFRQADLNNADLTKALLEDTVFSNLDLSLVKGLDEVYHLGPSTLDVRVLEKSHPLPLSFLRGCGLPNLLIDYIPSILSNGIEFYSCFISYSNQDKEFAKKLFDTLQGRGIRCWLDEKQLLPGDNIHDGIDYGIRLWDKVLLCASKNSLTSWWVDDEIEKAFQKEQRLMKERNKKILSLIPLNLDGFMFSNDYESGQKSQLQKRIAANFTKWKNHDKFSVEIDKVVAALRSDNGGRQPTPKPKI